MLSNSLIAALLCMVITVPTGAAGNLGEEPFQAGSVGLVNEQNSCPVTHPNGATPPGEMSSPRHHGNGTLWTILWPTGTVVFKPGGAGVVLEDGSLRMKFPWWRAMPDQLQIEGRRLDAPASPLRADIPGGYSKQFQATALIFPTPGCWEVTGRVGETKLSFVTLVVKIGNGPERDGRL